MPQTIAFLDFETTGLSPKYGDRPTEVAVVFVRSQKIVDRFQTLINPGRHIPRNIQALTGISNAMVQNAPSPVQAIRDVSRKIGDVPVIAHNASFDQKFFDAELLRAGRKRKSLFCCSMRVARRVVPGRPSYSLESLVKHVGLGYDSNAHRAMADAEMTARLWIEMEKKIHKRFQLEQVPFELMRRLQTVKISEADRYIREYSKKKRVSPGRTRTVRRTTTRSGTRGGLVVEYWCAGCDKRQRHRVPKNAQWFSCPRCSFKKNMATVVVTQ